MAIYGDEKHDAGNEVSIEQVNGAAVQSGNIQELSLDKVGLRLRVGVTAKGTRVGELVQGFERTFSEEGNDPATEAYCDAEEEFELYETALDALESLILAHATEGIDVTSEAYQNGILTALDAIGNNL